MIVCVGSQGTESPRSERSIFEVVGVPTLLLTPPESGCSPDRSEEAVEEEDEEDEENKGPAAARASPRLAHQRYT